MLGVLGIGLLGLAVYRGGGAPKKLQRRFYIRNTEDPTLYYAGQTGCNCCGDCEVQWTPDRSEAEDFWNRERAERHVESELPRYGEGFVVEELEGLRWRRRRRRRRR